MLLVGPRAGFCHVISRQRSLVRYETVCLTGGCVVPIALSMCLIANSVHRLPYSCGTDHHGVGR